MFFIDLVSKHSRQKVKKISRNLYRLKDNRVRPKSMPTRMKKKIFKMREKLKDSIARGK